MSLWEEPLRHLLAMWPPCALGPSPGRGDPMGPGIPGDFAGFSDVVANTVPRAWRTSATHLIGTVFGGTDTAHGRPRSGCSPDGVLGHSPVLGSQVPCWLQVQGTQLA